MWICVYLHWLAFIKLAKIFKISCCKRPTVILVAYHRPRLGKYLDRKQKNLNLTMHGPTFGQITDPLQVIVRIPMIKNRNFGKYGFYSVKLQ